MALAGGFADRSDGLSRVDCPHGRSRRRRGRAGRNHAGRRLQSPMVRSNAGHSAGLESSRRRTAFIPNCLTAVVELSSRYEIPIAMHLAESPEELELLRHGAGPLREFMENLGAWDATAIPPERGRSTICGCWPSAHRALVVHGNYLDDEEIAFLGANAGRMSVVYCPRTHDWFAHRAYPLEKMLAAGATVALGTDGRGSSPDLSLLDEMRFAAHAASRPSRRPRFCGWARFTARGAWAGNADRLAGARQAGRSGDRGPARPRRCRSARIAFRSGGVCRRSAIAAASRRIAPETRRSRSTAVDTPRGRPASASSRRFPFRQRRTALLSWKNPPPFKPAQSNNKPGRKLMSQSNRRRSPGMFDNTKYGVCNHGGGVDHDSRLGLRYIAQPISRYKSVSPGRWSPTSSTIVGVVAAATISVKQRIIRSAPRRWCKYCAKTRVARRAQTRLRAEWGDRRRRCVVPRSVIFNRNAKQEHRARSPAEFLFDLFRDGHVGDILSLASRVEQSSLRRENRRTPATR